MNFSAVLPFKTSPLFPQEKLRLTEELLENSKSSSGSMAVERADLMTQLEEARALNEQLARERASLERQMADGAEEARAAAGEREASLKRDLEAQLQKARQEGAEKARAELTGVQVGCFGQLFCGVLRGS